MAIPAPLPHPNEDVDHLAARASKTTFVEKAGAIRSNHNASARSKAEQIAGLYDTHITETTDAYSRLGDRRRERLEYLEGLVPAGPGIPSDASEADRAVLMQAFVDAWERVQNASRAGRHLLLAEAERFDNRPMRRAVLTYALDVSDETILRDWTQLHLDQKGYLEEVRKLRTTLGGGGEYRGFERQDFTPLPKPTEAYDWPLIADDPGAQPGDNGRMVRPGVIERPRR
ncbi:hypothetical protein ACIOKD_16605 [Streptomyces sp. NPDC087844]|uniref:hypothetical protein n=1 Tax=Streptomyces sp. NPDC087844 TaxID=3365805 RepID=UPI00382BE830